MVRTEFAHAQAPARQRNQDIRAPGHYGTQGRVRNPLVWNPEFQCGARPGIDQSSMEREEDAEAESCTSGILLLLPNLLILLQ